jgi:hypothetical protein
LKEASNGYRGSIERRVLRGAVERQTSAGTARGTRERAFVKGGKWANFSIVTKI